MEDLMVPICTGQWENHPRNEGGFVYSTFLMVIDETRLGFKSYVLI